MLGVIGGSGLYDLADLQDVERVRLATPFGEPSDEERERPRWWRFWRSLPARGRVGILFGSWYSEPIIRRVYGEIKSSKLDTEMDRIAFFEKMLADDGAVIVKLWFHLSKKAQRRRLKDLESDPKTHWRVLPSDWKHFKLYDKFTEVSERAIRRTDSGHAPWHLIEAADRRYRELTAGQILLQAIEAKLRVLKQPKPAPAARAQRAPVPSRNPNLNQQTRRVLAQHYRAKYGVK